MYQFFKMIIVVLFIHIFSGFTDKAFAAGGHGSPIDETDYASWDLDLDGQADALTDGLLLLRYIFGIRDNTLTTDVISPSSSISIEQIEARLATVMTIADIDGDSQVDALSDGLLVLRYLFGLRESQLIEGVVSPNATRISFSDIQDYLDSRLPGQSVADYDQDQIPDALDPDDDNDGLQDTDDPYPFNPLNGLDSDNDGLNDMLDEYPNDAENVIDTDGDGVANRFDVFPYDSSKAKAVVINLKGATSIGLGEALSDQNSSEQILASTFVKNNPRINSLLDIFISKAHASTTTSISNLTNAIAWNDQGQVLNGSILSSETLFIAEAALTPDGRYLYLLTSNHMQRAIDDIDDEVCSIYKVHMEDYKIECLLASDLGDIEPGSLKGTMQTDYSRSGIDFRSDGAGVMTGFDWAQELPSGVNGGTNSTIAWFLTSEGQLTSLLHEEGYFAVSALWLNDEYFAIAEYPFLGEDGPINPDHTGRIVIYKASDLSIHKRISAENIWGPTVRANGDIFWQYGGALDGETLEKYPSPIDGIPVTDNQSSILYGLVDYMGTENTLSSADESTEISLSDGIATGYEWRKGSGTGTDISYRTFAFNDEYIAYIKSFGAAEPIVSLEEHNLNNEGLDIALSDNRGRLLINGNAKDQWFIAPSSEQEGDLTIDYQVQTDTAIENRQLIISELTIDNWRSDASRPSVDSDARFEDAAIKWASPSPEREGICIYQFAIDDSVCALPQGNVVKTDMETFRSTRYDNEAVYPNGTGNAYPGIRNIFFDGGRMRVFYKDSDNHQYYQAVTEIDDFLVNGASAFTYTNAVNGQGEQNIVTDAISLKPEPARVLQGITFSLTNPKTINVSFPEPLSNVAPRPILVVDKSGQPVTQINNITWNETLTLATIELAEDITTLENFIVRTESAIFVRDSIQQYMINSDDFIEGFAPIGDLDTDGDGIINSLDNDDDNDGVDDTTDSFPFNPYETIDSDSDGVGDNSDLFPFDPNESRDSDEDGWGNNIDSFPLDETEWIDSDDDGYGDNQDAFPFDGAEWLDTDNDGYGDNQDAFLTDATEWLDSDGDGIGDNTDPSPFDDIGTGNSNSQQSKLASMALSFGGSEINLGDNGNLVYRLSADAEDWAGFANETEELYPISFSEIGNISFIGSVPSNETVNIRFRFEKNPHPDVDPAYDTTSVPITGSNEQVYSIDIPSQGDNHFSSLIMYVEEIDKAVALREISITANYEVSSDQNSDTSENNTSQYNCGSYCSESNGLLYYHFALNEYTESFPIHLGGDSLRLEYSGGLGGGSFIYTDSSDQKILVELDDFNSGGFSDALKNNSHTLVLEKNGNEPIDNSFRIYDGEVQVGILNLVSNNGDEVNNIKQLHPRLIVNRVETGTGSRHSDQCSEFSLEGLAEGISHHGQISLVPDILITGGAMNLLGMGGENSIYICENTPIGSYQITMQAIDGQGGKKLLPLQIDVLNESIDGGSMEWADCGNDYCQFMAGQFYYQFALNAEATNYPFHLYSEKYMIHSAGGLSSAGFLLYENNQATRIFSSYDENTDNYIPMDSNKLTEVIQANQGGLTLSRNANEGIDNSFHIYASDQGIGTINLVSNQGATVFDIVQNYNTLYVDPVNNGTGSREDNKCNEFSMDDFASGIQHHGQISLLPDNLITGGSMSLLGFGGENSIYVCQDTPAGQYEINFIAMDGSGGKRNFELTVIVSENPVDNGAILWQ